MSAEAAAPVGVTDGDVARLESELAIKNGEAAELDAQIQAEAKRKTELLESYQANLPGIQGDAKPLKETAESEDAEQAGSTNESNGDGGDSAQAPATEQGRPASPSAAADWREQVGQHLFAGDNGNENTAVEEAAKVGSEGTEAALPAEQAAAPEQECSAAQQWRDEVGQHLYTDSTDESGRPGTSVASDEPDMPASSPTPEESSSARHRSVRDWREQVGQHLGSGSAGDGADAPGASFAAAAPHVSKLSEEEAAAEAEFEAQEQELAAVTIQSRVRGHKARKDQETLQQAAVIVQSGIRGMLERNRFTERMIAVYLRNIAATAIQKNVRRQQASKVDDLKLSKEASGAEAAKDGNEPNQPDNAAIESDKPELVENEADGTREGKGTDARSEAKSEPAGAENIDNNQSPNVSAEAPPPPLVYPAMKEACYIAPPEPGSELFSLVRERSRDLARVSSELLRLAATMLPNCEPEDPNRYRSAGKASHAESTAAAAILNVCERPAWMAKRAYASNGPSSASGGGFSNLHVQSHHKAPLGRDPGASSYFQPAHHPSVPRAPHPLQHAPRRSLGEVATPGRRTTQLSDSLSRAAMHDSPGVTRFSPTLRSLKKRRSSVKSLEVQTRPRGR
eukprot:INCI5823.1.p1 GENE.INCI5823.1~~INCI5823.1.p1  ORF type:complete len:625 (-),score=118.51 INCI5823.1:88-1962(-)